MPKAYERELKEIVSRDPLAPLFEQDKELIWRFRYPPNTNPQCCHCVCTQGTPSRVHSIVTTKATQLCQVESSQGCCCGKPHHYSLSHTHSLSPSSLSPSWVHGDLCPLRKPWNCWTMLIKTPMFVPMPCVACKSCRE